MTEKERYWEVWSKDHVDRIEKEVWGEAGLHPRGRHHELVRRHVALIPRGTKTILEVGAGMGISMWRLRILGMITSHWIPALPWLRSSRRGSQRQT